jgi:uncharacterized phosphosugar-binding protein
VITVGWASGVAGNMLLHATICHVIGMMIDRGIEPQLVKSANYIGKRIMF